MNVYEVEIFVLARAESMVDVYPSSHFCAWRAWRCGTKSKNHFKKAGRQEKVGPPNCQERQPLPIMENHGDSLHDIVGASSRP
jgi:hypothetical protein